jgi:TIM-barrel protein
VDVTLLVKNLFVQAAMAGWSDGSFCKAMAQAGAGVVTLGGYNVDRPTHLAGSKASARRREFVIPPDRLPEHVRKEVSLIPPTGALTCINVRFTHLPDLVRFCRDIRGVVDIVELNAHCRQPEFTRIGAGEALLARGGQLCEAVEACSSFLPTLVKMRAIHLPTDLLGPLHDAGATGVHLDLMKPDEARADLTLLERVRDATELTIIGNNSVKDEATFLQMLEKGANVVSMARALMEGPEPIENILGSEECWKAMRRASPIVAGEFQVGGGAGTPKKPI